MLLFYIHFKTVRHYKGSKRVIIPKSCLIKFVTSKFYEKSKQQDVATNKFCYFLLSHEKSSQIRPCSQN